jgi:hypothetical protein
MDDFRSQRREVREGDRTIIREPGRTIIKQGDVTVIRRDESDRFRYGARNMIAEANSAQSRSGPMARGSSTLLTTPAGWCGGCAVTSSAASL